MINASCLCRSVRFTLEGDLHAPRYCYCRNCTKFSGTSPATWAMAKRSEMAVTASGRVSEFDSGRGLRCFCASCGSPVWFESKDDPEIVAIPLGVLDDGSIPPPDMHIWVGARPDWCTIHDALPQYETNP